MANSYINVEIGLREVPSVLVVLLYVTSTRISPYRTVYKKRGDRLGEGMPARKASKPEGEANKRLEEYNSD